MPQIRIKSSGASPALWLSTAELVNPLGDNVNINIIVNINFKIKIKIKITYAAHPLRTLQLDS